MSIKRGVSLYSYQQSQFFKELDLEAQIAEVGENLEGVDGIEIIDEMSLRYPNPGLDFERKWFGMMEKYGTVPVTMDVGMDVLQFRDHVMSIEECTHRLRQDIRLAKKLGFANVRVLSTTPAEMLELALPLAESLDIKLGKEVHQPMTLEGNVVTEIIELAEKLDTKHIGIVPDFGIFQTRPSEVQLSWFVRRGANPASAKAVVELSDLLARGGASFGYVDMSLHTAGNLRSDFRKFLMSGICEPEFGDAFNGIKSFAEDRINEPAEIDYIVVSEALMISNTSSKTLHEIADHITCVHGKFNNMSPIPDKEGQYQDISIDYESSIAALISGGFDGYICSEYEGQRYSQDRGKEDLMDEVQQVRRHQEMLSRLLA